MRKNFKYLFLSLILSLFMLAPADAAFAGGWAGGSYGGGKHGIVTESHNGIIRNKYKIQRDGDLLKIDLGNGQEERITKPEDPTDQDIYNAIQRRWPTGSNGKKKKIDEDQMNNMIRQVVEEVNSATGGAANFDGSGTGEN